MPNKRTAVIAVPLSSAQRDLLERVRTDMEKDLLLKLSRASVMERLLKLYLKDHPRADPVYLQTDKGLQEIPSFLTMAKETYIKEE